MRKVFILSVAFLLLIVLPVAGFSKDREVEAVIVSATLSPILRSHVTGAVTILTAKDLENLGQVFLVDALRFVPGLSISQEGGAGTLASVRIRGGESDHTKVFIDGVEVNETSSSVFNFGSLLTGQIERIEIVRGAQSLVLGANATAGVIYITTKQSGADFHFLAGSHGTLEFGGTIGGRARSGFSASLGADLYRSDGHDISSAGIDEKDGYFKAGLNAKFGFDKTIAQHQVKIASSLRYFANKLNGDSFDVGAPDGASLQKDRQMEAGLDIVYQLDLPLMFFLRQTLNGSIFDLKNNYNGADSKQRRLTTHYGVSIQWNRMIYLDGLLGWEQEAFQQAGQLEHQEVERFVATEARFSYGGVDLSAGIRGQFYNNSKDGLLWRTSAGWTPVFQKIIRLHGSYGTSLNQPSLNQLYGYYPPGYSPNPNLRPESAVSWDGGVDLDFSSLWNRSLLLRASVFGLDVEDEISGLTTPINIEGVSKRIGGEMEAEWQIGDLTFIKDIILSAAYTYTRSKQANGQPLLNRPKHVASAHMGWSWARFGFGWDLSWQSHQFAYNGRIHSYPLLNVQLRYRFNENLFLFIQAQNLTDERTANTVGYQRRGLGFYFGLRGKL